MEKETRLFYGIEGQEILDYTLDDILEYAKDSYRRNGHHKIKTHSHSCF